MKNLRKGFTLVEMLIVVVIIGILAAALLPKMMGAQDSARDAGRLVALRDLGTAISSYQAQKGEFPLESTVAGYTVDLKDHLVKGGYIKEIPADPVKNNKFAGFVDGSDDANKKNSYQYLYLKRNGLDNGAVALVAKVQTDGNANYVVAGADAAACTTTTKIADSDIKDKDATGIQLCSKVEPGNANTFVAGSTCVYKDKECLRYVLIQ